MFDELMLFSVQLWKNLVKIFPYFFEMYQNLYQNVEKKKHVLTQQLFTYSYWNRIIQIFKFLNVKIQIFKTLVLNNPVVTKYIS